MLSPDILPIANSRLFVGWWFPRPISTGVPGGRGLGHDELPQPARVGHHLLHISPLFDSLKTPTLPGGFLVLNKRAQGDARVRVLRDPFWPPLVLRPMVLAPASVRVSSTCARRQGAAFSPLPGESLFTRIQPSSPPTRGSRYIHQVEINIHTLNFTGCQCVQAKSKM